MAPPALILRDMEQSFVALVLVVAVRTVPHLSGNLARMMRSDALRRHDGSVRTFNAKVQRAAIQEPTMTGGARLVHGGSCLAPRPQRTLPATPRLDVALFAIETRMRGSERTRREDRFHTVPIADHLVSDGHEGQRKNHHKGEPIQETAHWALGHIVLPRAWFRG